MIGVSTKRIKLEEIIYILMELDIPIVLLNKAVTRTVCLVSHGF